MTIHPALPVLLLLTVAPLVLPERWRGGPRRWVSPSWAVTWAAIGLAGIALLLPVLRIPDGMPSPAALLAEQAPWQSEVSAAAGQPVQRDVVYQIQPWLLFARGELRAGRLPFWNPHQYAGSPFWANGQSAPLFPLHLLFAVLPLSLGWVLLPWLRFLIAGMGAWALARKLGVASRGALLAGLIFPLSGMPVGFLQFPMGNALVLVPWVLLAVEWVARPAAGSKHSLRTVAGLAAAVCLQSLGGHPGTVLHTALLSVVYLAVRGADGWRGWARCLAGWGLGGALAAVQLVPLALFVQESSRWQAVTPAFQQPLGRLLVQPLRLVLPGLYGDPAAGTWWGPYNYLATSVYAGAGAIALAAVGLADRWKRHKSEAIPTDRRPWIAICALLLLCLAGAYHWPVVRQVLQALPVVGKVVQHRLLFGVDLALALAAGAGLEAWLAGRGRRSLYVGAALTLGLTACAVALHFDAWRQHELHRSQGLWAAGVVAVVLLLVALPRSFRTARGRFLGWTVALLFAVDLLVAHGSLMPALSRSDFFPLTPAVEFLTARSSEGRIAASGRTLHPNAATVYRLSDIRGDDTLKLASYQDFSVQHFGVRSPTYFDPIARWDAEALDLLAVRWVMTPPGTAAPAADWSVAYDGADGRILERPAVPSTVRWATSDGSDRSLSVVSSEPGRWLIDWSTPTAATVVVAETAAAGWRLTGHSGPRPEMESVAKILLGAVVGPGEGRLEWVYRPPGFGAGVALSAFALLISCGLLWRALGRRAK
ncbi:MAG: hypothetical protein AAF481_06365 [Acidobacteriota bacterium]